MPDSSYNLSVEASALNTAIAQAAAAAPQSTTYSKTEVDELVKGYGEAIPANSDLDDYVDNGQFYIATSTIWGTITNVPSMPRNTNARLIVIGLNSDSNVRCTQILITNFGVEDQEGRIYMRQLYSADTWSPWYMFEGVALTQP